MIERGNDLNVFLARSGKMLADAKYHLDAKTQSVLIDELRKAGTLAGIPATTINILIKSSCKQENYLVNWLERINRTCVHQLDWLRTCISKAKEEARLGGRIG
jgi:hypothetical protein